MTRLFLSPPHMSGRERVYIEDAFASNYVAPAGPMIDAFESAFAAYTGIPHMVALTSGTAAMHLALKCLSLERGDQVWASTLTFIGNIAGAVHDGLVPVFLDADPNTWTLDTSLLEDELQSAEKHGHLPKAVIPTDLYGQSCDLDLILEICARYNVAVISDSAEAAGTRYKNRHSGDGGFAAVFSFNGNKIITTSGGGMLASHDKRVIDRARYLSTQARQPFAHYEHTEAGYNYRMSNICAAIGRGQLEVLGERVARRREIFEHYKTLLSDLPGISFMPEANYGRSSRWLTVILIDSDKFGISSEAVRLALESEDIETRPIWKPMHMQPVFKAARRVGGAVAERLFEQGLCLPSGSQMSDADVEHVADAIRTAPKKVTISA
jgi:dTDP-4-amino-4,6-dideoxygalactose transaminase